MIRRLWLTALLITVIGLGTLAGILTWQDVSRRQSGAAAVEAVAAASEATIAMLTYKADTVESDLNSARGRLTGTFVDSYNKLITDVVIPGAKQKRISAAARIPAAAAVTARQDHAVALVFVDQTVTVGDSPPTASGSSVRVTMDKVDGTWLVSGFDPI